MVSDHRPGGWGPRLLRDGVEFRLWAPSASRLELVTEGPGAREIRSMDRQEGGWWQTWVAGAGPGTRYRYRVDGHLDVPDPASRFQPGDCHGPSQVVDTGTYAWRTTGWAGRPWCEAVVYELHVGSFTPAGTYLGVMDALDTLVELGVTAIELMPLADFPGTRNWGYDGVLPFAPDHRYGPPLELMELIDAAHERRLMVLLDVVYNHFGPDGNYLGAYAQPFFTDRHKTPWGDAIDFDGPSREVTRGFFIDNALYWLDEYRFDGLRLDAVHAICDDSDPHILPELARRVREGPGQSRHVHLILENDANEARWLSGPPLQRYDAQWNDDFHHAVHVIVTGESDSYYGDYADAPVGHLLRTLTEGFAYQGEFSAHRGGPRGEPSAHLPVAAFVSFLQNHDQVGNRAAGERLHEITSTEALTTATAILLLSPMPPLLFMGQEWCASSPFPYFCDHRGELAEAIRRGRMREFEHFSAFSGPDAHQRIPDPLAPETFAAAILDWSERLHGEHGRWWRLHRDLLTLRQQHVVPLVDRVVPGGSTGRLLGDAGLTVLWPLAGGAHYLLHANLGGAPLSVSRLPGQRIYATPGVPPATPALSAAPVVLPAWSAVFSLEAPDEEGAHD